MSEYRFVCNSDDISAGQYLAFTINNRAILVCNYQGAFYAIEDKCSHAPAKLNGGKFKDCVISCPLHGAKFDVRDGSAQGKPAFTGITQFDLKCINNEILVRVEQQTTQQQYAAKGSPFAPPPPK